MSKTERIVALDAVEVLDSRGHPTVMAQIVLGDGSRGGAMVPSGASTGQYEAWERRDGDPQRYGGKGVSEVVAAIRGEIADCLVDSSAHCQEAVDERLCRLDGTKNKERLGANATLAVSLAYARAVARAKGKPLWQTVTDTPIGQIPCPMMNVLNGGAHADNNLDIQEFMIVPDGAPNFTEAVRCGSEIYHALGRLLKERGLSTAVGDEGGFAPNLTSEEEALDLLCRAIAAAGYDTETVHLALDVAASEWVTEGGYALPKAGVTLTADELIVKWQKLAADWPIISIEDPLGDDDFDGWRRLTDRLGARVRLVGDDLFVTQEARLKKGIEKGLGNAILIKPNQVGTVTETVETVLCAERAGYLPILSHRSGDTEDPAIADLAIAMSVPLIKSGAPCRAERTAKYNRLLTVEHNLQENASFGGKFL